LWTGAALWSGDGERMFNPNLRMIADHPNNYFLEAFEVGDLTCRIIVCFLLTVAITLLQIASYNPKYIEIQKDIEKIKKVQNQLVCIAVIVALPACSPYVLYSVYTLAPIYSLYAL
jgi:hypothetical protein